MAVTGPIQAPVTFNTVYELDDLVKFLAKTQTDLDTRFDLINDMIGNIELNDCGLIMCDNIRKMLDNSVALCEDLATSMSVFTHGLIEKKFLKRNTSLPQMNTRDRIGLHKSDSGIAYESASSSSEPSPEASESRLSVFGVDMSEAINQKQVCFDLLTPSTSSTVLDEQADLNGNSLTSVKQGTSKVFVHLIPLDPGTDLSALRAELYDFSASVLTSHNIEVQLVPSDTFMGLSTRHISTSSEGQSSARSRFRSSNDSVGVLAWNNLSRFAIEHSETSEEDNNRQLSSSDSDASIRRYQLKPVTEKKSVETQTE